MVINVLLLINGKTLGVFSVGGIFLLSWSVICVLSAIVYLYFRIFIVRERSKLIWEYIGPYIMFGYAMIGLLAIVPISGYIGSKYFV